MTEPVIVRSCTVLSLSVSDSETSAHAAFLLAQKLSKTCTTLIISTPASEQSAHASGRVRRRNSSDALAKGAEAAGLATDIKPLSFDEALSELSIVPQDDFIILLQPDHPLDRQAPSFQRLSKAALRAPGRTIYSPRQINETGEYILVVGSSPALDSFASALSQQTGLARDTLAPSASPAELRHSILALAPAQRPALIVLENSDRFAGPSAYMKLAALTGIPVLVL